MQVMFSSIQKKKCKGNCGRYPVLGYGGFCRSCAPDEIKEKVGNKRKQAQQRSYEKAKIRSLHSLPANKSMVEKNKDVNKIDIELWYKRQRKYMTGKCCNCHKSSSKDNEKYWKWSIAHVFPKNLFKSVAMDDDNWIELCLTCHTDFDRSLATASEMECFRLAFAQYQKFKDKITETHKFHDLFLEYTNQL